MGTDSNNKQTPWLQENLKVWLADLTYTQQTVAADTIPFAIGSIATYTELTCNLKNPIHLFKYPEKLIEQLETNDFPNVIGLTNYVWNGELALNFARAIRKHSPETVIVMGGPNYPTEVPEQQEYLFAHPEIDFYIIKEGEDAFAELIAALIRINGNTTTLHGQIDSIHSVCNGEPFITNSRPRLRNLDIIPSPYLSGKLDSFFDGTLLPIIQTNRGCPFTCTFCVEGAKYYLKIAKHEPEYVARELCYIGEKMRDVQKLGGRNDLFIADSNFGMYPDDLKTCATLAHTQSEYSWPEYINVATGKNQKERVLKAAELVNGAMRLSGSVQSLDKNVLKNIKRDNISAEKLMDLALAASEVQANSYSEIILALPGDSLNAHIETIRTVIDAGFTNIFLFQLMLLPGTDMNTKATREEYKMQTRYRVLPRCYGNYTLFGEQFSSAEIEEICVANATLSFQDYLQCRLLHLVVTIFYNDALFAALLKTLRHLNISPLIWMDKIVTSKKSTALTKLFEEFTAATESELWKNHNSLREFTKNPDNINKFIAGELGNNLLFTFKARAISQHAEELATTAQDTIFEILKEGGTDSPELVQFVKEATQYQKLRMLNMFTQRDRNPEDFFTYNIFLYENSSNEPINCKYPQPTKIIFKLSKEQQELCDRYIKLYGDDTVGIGRILSKVYVRKLFRNPVSEVKQTDETLATPHKDRYQISGLQN